MPASTPPVLASRPMRHWLASLVLAGLGLWLAAPPALAQDAPYDRVQRLLQAGEWTLALTEAQAWLAHQPRDPQMRLLIGVVQQKRGDLAAARETFLALTREFPELPEPYNNLAAIHAAQGRWSEAVAALVMALRLNPAYATAHRNLGDLYLRLAANAYRDALLHAPGTADAAQQLLAVEKLLAATPPR